jgi:hypothetical protein
MEVVVRLPVLGDVLLRFLALGFVGHRSDRSAKAFALRVKVPGLRAASESTRPWRYE